jgi:hypothetical protein
LDEAHTSNIAEAVGPAVDIGPDYVNVEVIDQVFSSDIALKSNGALNGGKDILGKSQLMVTTEYR